MDDRLTWKHHTYELRNKINTSVGMIFKMKILCPQRVHMSLYYSLIYSHLCCSICIWGDSDDIYGKMEKYGKRWKNISINFIVIEIKTAHGA